MWPIGHQNGPVGLRNAIIMTSRLEYICGVQFVCKSMEDSWLRTLPGALLENIVLSIILNKAKASPTRNAH